MVSGGCQPRVYIIPQEFSTEAYTNLLEIPGLTSSIGIAFARTILGTLLTLLCCSFTGIPAGKQGFALQKAAVPFFIVTMYVNAGFIPLLSVNQQYRTEK